MSSLLSVLIRFGCTEELSTKAMGALALVVSFFLPQGPFESLFMLVLCKMAPYLGCTSYIFTTEDVWDVWAGLKLFVGKMYFEIGCTMCILHEIYISKSNHSVHTIFTYLRIFFILLISSK